MKEFDPLKNVEHSQLILDGRDWPNFHDAQVQELNIWRGDLRANDNVWIGPVLEASFELNALQDPYIAVLRFYDCEAISLHPFDQHSAILDLTFSFEDRGALNDGTPMTPTIAVSFTQAFGVALSFRCFKVEAVGRRGVGSVDLARLLSSLTPELLPEEFVFCTVADDALDYAKLSPLATFREKEGVTLVLDLGVAEQAGLAFESVFRCITLGVHSSLDAVGLTAAVSSALAQRGISANVIAAYHHDHIFVPVQRAHDALVALQSLGR
ncbi:MAG: hypothetical protein ACI9JM_001566 [Halioglobus sp.]|jgi:hypothetical protein